MVLDGGVGGAGKEREQKKKKKKSRLCCLLLSALVTVVCCMRAARCVRLSTKQCGHNKEVKRRSPSSLLQVCPPDTCVIFTIRVNDRAATKIQRGTARYEVKRDIFSLVSLFV